MVARGLKNKQVIGFRKNRRIFVRNVRPLVFGTSGLRIIKRALFPRTQILNTITWSKWYLCKRRWRMSAFWMRGRAAIPMTRKIKNTRMGHGKGKLRGYFFVSLFAGFFYIELRWFAYYRMRRYYTFMTPRLPIKTIPVFKKVSFFSVFFLKTACYKFSKTSILQPQQWKGAAFSLEGRLVSAQI